MDTSFRSIRPAADEYLEYYGKYISRVPDGDIVESLKQDLSQSVQFFRGIPESKFDYRYAPDKWSVREVIGHLSDGERVFQYRAWRFSRADETPVPGFEENLYVANAPFPRVSMPDLIAEFESLRRASIHLFENLDAESMVRRGTANNAAISVRALAYIMVGHVIHHIGVLKERYL
ncbi:MAG TPA: DinB family protein [Gemmatimonadaceae bacterium]|nr:DinB family protein [Gemmatimonadaceae bacterium]